MSSVAIDFMGSYAATPATPPRRKKKTTHQVSKGFAAENDTLDENSAGQSAFFFSDPSLHFFLNSF